MTIDLDVIKAAYGWTITDDGEVYGLIAGDMGYESTGIFIPMEHLLCLLTNDNDKIENTLGYKAGYEIAINKVAMLHAVEAARARRDGDTQKADAELQWARKIRGVDDDVELPDNPA